MADSDNYQHIGKNFVPPDVVGKVTGRAKYTADVSVDGMLYARMYVSPIPHGRVTHLDLSESLALEGVYGAITADDVPAARSADRTILTNEPMYVGEPIFAIAAVDERTAENAMALARINIEPLPFEVDPLSSLKNGGANANTEGNIYQGGAGNGVSELKWSEQDLQNFISKQQLPDAVINEWQYGDLEQGFSDASIVIEEAFVTSGYSHMCMEPRSTLAYWQNGKCHVYGSTQSQSFILPYLAGLLEIELKDLVYIGENCGGGFGSKIGPYPSMAIPVFLSKKIGRAVMLRVTREEEYYLGTARVGFQGRVKIGFKSDGAVSAVDLFIVQDIGSHSTGGDASSAGGAISILYQPQAMRFRGLPVLTNTTPRGAQRGPGQNQIAAVMGPIMDAAARQLNMDRVEIRRINAPDSNSRINANQGPVTSAYMKQALELGAQMFAWDKKLGEKNTTAAHKVIGLGIGQGYHSAGAKGFDGLVRITPDGKIHLHSGVGNLGTYSYASTTRSAAEVLKCDWENCVVEYGSTEASLPWSSYQAGSNTSFTHSRANYAAASDAVEKIKQIAAQVLGGGSSEYDIANERVFSKATPSKSMSYAQVAQEAIKLGGAYSGASFPDDIHPVTQIAVQQIAGSGLIGVAKDKLPQEGTVPGLAVCFMQIELDTETGKYEILDHVAIAECGTVVHPQGLYNQMSGGAVWGIGLAGYERHAYDPQNGLPANVGFHQCKPPTYLDTPLEIKVGAVDLPDPQSPFGIRGIGEPAMGCASAALMGALSDALEGRLFNQSPVTADMIINLVRGEMDAEFASGVAFNPKMKAHSF